MSRVMPQEMEVWYLIPALRRELSKMFVKDYHLSQKETANLLGVTEAAISQYSKKKRANEVVFSKQSKDEIAKAAERIISEKRDVAEVLYDISLVLRKKGILCEMHKKKDPKIAKNCAICFR